MTPTKEFFCDMMRAPLDRIIYKTCIKNINEDGTFKVNRIDLDDEFMAEYEKYLDTLVQLLHALDHYTFLPFIAMWRENGIDNVDGWFNGGIKLPNQKMIRFYIMKKDSPMFSYLPLGHTIRFWDYNSYGGKHTILEGDEAYDEMMRLINTHIDIPNTHPEIIKKYYAKPIINDYSINDNSKIIYKHY